MEKKKYKIMVAGQGAIGSHVTGLLARMNISSIVLIDKDAYEKKNLKNQNITAFNVGQAKAVEQAQRLRYLNAGVNVEGIVDDIHNVSWGRFRGCDVVLGCVDNNEARQLLAEISWRLGIVYIDAGVRKEKSLVRVDVYMPGSDAPCLQCGWTKTDYDRLTMKYPCDKGQHAPAATDSPAAYLGALAATLQVAQLEKVLSGDRSDAGTRTVVSPELKKYYYSRLTRNKDCRFDHTSFTEDMVNKVSPDLSVIDLLGLDGMESEDGRQGIQGLS